MALEKRKSALSEGAGTAEKAQCEALEKRKSALSEGAGTKEKVQRDERVDGVGSGLRRRH